MIDVKKRVEAIKRKDRVKKIIFWELILPTIFIGIMLFLVVFLDGRKNNSEKINGNIEAKMMKEIGNGKK